MSGDGGGRRQRLWLRRPCVHMLAAAVVLYTNTPKTDEEGRRKEAGRRDGRTEGTRDGGKQSEIEGWLVAHGG